MPLLITRHLVACVAAGLPALAMASGVSVRFDEGASPFPSNALTTLDFSNATYRQVNLPKPDCALRPSDCADIDVTNQLDGFSTQPRITVPFNGDIDVASVNSDSIFLVNLGDTQTFRGFGDRVGINQVLWDPASKTLVFEPNESLAERSRYVLVVTNGVRDAQGQPLARSNFGEADDRRFLRGLRRDLQSYQRELRGGVDSVRMQRGQTVVAASLFTTQSVTTDLVKIMRQIKYARPAPVNFSIATSASGAPARAVFSVADVSGIALNRQSGVNGQAPVFATSALPLAALQVVPGAVAQVAYGEFMSPNYRVAGGYIPPVKTLTGWPRAQGREKLVFELFVPAGAKPAGGWPVAIFGHGFTVSMHNAPWVAASVLASRGIATLAINVVGHGGGSQGRLVVTTASGGVVQLPAGGRGVDQDGNGVIDSTEGVEAVAPRSVIGNRDGLRQTVVDLMQLVRQVEVGMDVDADGVADLNAQRIYYAGQSFGSIYGATLMGVEPAIKAGVLNVGGGSLVDVGRLGSFRFITAAILGSRQPQVLNLPPTPGVPLPFGLNFNENIPLRDLPPVVNSVPGAMEISRVLDRYEWVQQQANPVSYAHLIRKQPLYGQEAKPVILQMAKGDATVPNPTNTALVRAGGLQDRTSYFRNDLAFAADPTVPKNPHTFLTNIGEASTARYAVQAQSQVAVFFQSAGATTIDPDGPGPIFEVPINATLPEGLNFIP